MGNKKWTKINDGKFMNHCRVGNERSFFSRTRKDRKSADMDRVSGILLPRLGILFPGKGRGSF